MATILIVDDSEVFRAQLRAALQEGKYEVLEACDGYSGLEALKQHSSQINLVLCDINMPGMDGLTMCDMVKKEGNLKSIPIFMLTTEASAEMKIRGKEIGVMGWIIKPYNKEKLLMALEKVISKFPKVSSEKASA